MMKRASYFKTYKGRKKRWGGGGGGVPSPQRKMYKHRRKEKNNLDYTMQYGGSLAMDSKRKGKKERDKHYPSLCCLYYR
jgi:hypothetical protein